MSQFFDEATGEVTTEGAGCPDCARALAERIDAEQKLRAVERQLTKSLTNEARLRTELINQREESPEGKLTRALGRYWIARCGKNPKRTKLGEKRLKAVTARLREGRDPMFIVRAIDGAAVAANTRSPETERLALIRVMQEAIRRVDDQTAAELRGIYREAMANVAKFDDLELICRDETKLERFYELAERVNAATLAGPAWVKEFGGNDVDGTTDDIGF